MRFGGVILNCMIWVTFAHAQNGCDALKDLKLGPRCRDFGEVDGSRARASADGFSAKTAKHICGAALSG